MNILYLPNDVHRELFSYPFDHITVLALMLTCKQLNGLIKNYIRIISDPFNCWTIHAHKFNLFPNLVRLDSSSYIISGQFNDIIKMILDRKELLEIGIKMPYREDEEIIKCFTQTKLINIHLYCCTGSIKIFRKPSIVQTKVIASTSIFCDIVDDCFAITKLTCKRDIIRPIIHFLTYYQSLKHLKFTYDFTNNEGGMDDLAELLLRRPNLTRITAKQRVFSILKIKIIEKIVKRFFSRAHKFNLVQFLPLTLNFYKENLVSLQKIFPQLKVLTIATTRYIKNIDDISGYSIQLYHCA